MAYIGKSPANVKKDLTEKDLFTGDGSTVAFDLTNVALDANSLQVFVDNVRQEPGAGKSYTLGNDGSGDLKRITFTVAPEDNAVIYALNPGVKDSVLNTVSDSAITEAKLGTGAVTSAKIADGTIANADVSPSAAIADSKLATITTASKVNVSALSAPGSASVFLRGDRTYGAVPTDQIDSNAFNISLLGFKMAVNEGLTVFNLVDGIVDEFHDESGTDEAEGSNDTYCASSDLYQNVTSPITRSAGFAEASVTEGDTSTSGGAGGENTFTVPSGITSVNMFAWGSGGSGGAKPSEGGYGGGGGYSEGTLAVTGSQVLKVNVGEGGATGPREGGSGGLHPQANSFPGSRGGGDGAGESEGTGGGGLTGIAAANLNAPGASAPQIYLISGSGGGGASQPTSNFSRGGAGGGLTGGVGHPNANQTSASDYFGGGGDQEQGGQGGNYTGGPGPNTAAQSGGFLYGGSASAGGGGGAGYYGGGGGNQYGSDNGGAGGGGSSYYGHPQITSGSTCSANSVSSSPYTAEAVGEGGGIGKPNYAPGTNEGGSTAESGENGYVLITACQAGSTTSTTIVSNAFTSTSVPTTSRIVVFQENIDTPTINTDVIASISRDGGSNFTTATLTDSGYVTGSSGQRILTGQATISGQPSGQSMRWKLALANNAVKIHGVSLQWA